MSSYFKFQIFDSRVPFFQCKMNNIDRIDFPALLMNRESKHFEAPFCLQLEHCSELSKHTSARQGWGHTVYVYLLDLYMRVKELWLQPFFVSGEPFWASPNSSSFRKETSKLVTIPVQRPTCK